MQPHSTVHFVPQTAAGSSQSIDRCLVHTTMSTSGRVTRGPVIHTEVFHKQRLTCTPADWCRRCPQEFSTYQQRILLLLPGAPRSSTLPHPLRGRMGSTRGAGGMGKWRAGSPRGWRAQHRSYALRSVARVDPVAVRTEAAPPGGEAPTPAPTARCRVAHAWGGVPRQIGTPRTPRRTGPAAPTGTAPPSPLPRRVDHRGCLTRGFT